MAMWIDEDILEILFRIAYVGVLAIIVLVVVLVGFLIRGLVEKEIKSATVTDLTSLTTYLDELEDRIISTFTKIGVKELLAENENNYKYIAQLERRNKRLEKQLKELKNEHLN